MAKDAKVMRLKTATAVMAAVLLSAGAPPVAQAGCIRESLQREIANPDVVAIFRGTVTGVKEVPLPPGDPSSGPRQAVMMTVSSVWKGEVARETTLYFQFGTGSFGPAQGAEYLVLAQELSVGTREWFGLPRVGERALGAIEYGCGIMAMAQPSTMTFIGTTPGYSPK